MIKLFLFFLSVFHSGSSPLYAIDRLQLEGIIHWKMNKRNPQWSGMELITWMLLCVRLQRTWEALLPCINSWSHEKLINGLIRLKTYKNSTQHEWTVSTHCRYIMLQLKILFANVCYVVSDYICKKQLLYALKSWTKSSEYPLRTWFHSQQGRAAKHCTGWFFCISKTYISKVQVKYKLYPTCLISISLSKTVKVKRFGKLQLG